MRDTILRFVEQRAGTKIDPTTPLFTSGLIDSFGVLELIAFLEETFKVDINPARHQISEFDTVARIESLVQGLL